MAENSEVEVRDRTKHQPLTHLQFFQACKAMEEEKDYFLRERPSAPRAAEKLSGMCGFRVSAHAVEDLKKATNILWEYDRSAAQLKGNPPRPRKSRAAISVADATILAVAIAELYRRNGGTMSEDMAALHARLTSRL